MARQVMPVDKRGGREEEMLMQFGVDMAKNYMGSGAKNQKPGEQPTDENYTDIANTEEGMAGDAVSRRMRQMKGGYV